MSSVENLYNVEKILDVRFVNGKPEYKIKWENYPISQCTWEPVKNLETIPQLIEEYNKSHPTKLETKKTKSKHLINKKRKKPKNEKNNSEKKIKEEKNENLNEKEENKENKNEKEEENDIKLQENDEDNFKVDKTLTEVITVKMQSGKLMALVNKEEENGEGTKSYISTEELRKINPWILLNFYESKIKFN